MTIQEVKQNPQNYSFEFSDRWIAKMSGTSKLGNRLDTVAETIRKYGLVSESSYPTPDNYTWDEYHAEIPESLLSKLKAEGQEWLTKWDIKYSETSITKKSIQNELKQVPPQVVIPGHAIENISSTAITNRIFDSYAPFIKDIPGEIYPSDIIYALKIVLYKKEQALDPDMLLVNLKYGNTGNQVLRLKRVLKRLGWNNAQGVDLKPGDIYDNNLAWVVMNWKLANSLAHSYWARQWERFGPAVLGFKGREFNAKDREYINFNLKNNGNN